MDISFWSILTMLLHWVKTQIPWWKIWKLCQRLVSRVV
jgi:hypothetical protein